MQVLEFGRHLLDVSTFLTGAILVLSIFGIATKDRRFVQSARIGFYGLFILIAASSGCLIYGFVSGQYNNEYVYRYSSRALATPYKVAGLWAGLQGSLLFWTLILCAYSAVGALQHRWSSRDPIGRRLEPYFYAVLSVVIGFFVVVVAHEANPFEVMALERRLSISADGIVPDGHGLNPQLENYWMAIHPPTLYVGLVGFTIPFAFSIAALLAGEMGDYWVKITRRWTLVAWSFLTFGVILGGLWAYEMLGWGGYWAWDPVENASILPWFVGTAFLHSVMVQERRDMLKGWNVFLIVLTFFMTIVATYMTRSGVVESVHAFSEGEVGKFFLPFMLGIAILSALLLGYRARFLRGSHQLESFYSREAAFFFNNLVLLALMITVYLLSMSGKLTHDFILTKRSARGPVYNLVSTPLFLLLLFLTGIGPQLGWVKTSKSLLRRRLFWPTIAGLVACAVALPHWVANDEVPSPFRDASIADAQGTEESSKQEAVEVSRVDLGMDEIDASGLIGDSAGWLAVEKYHYYSTLVGFGLAIFILATILAELRRGVRARVVHRGESRLVAGILLILGGNRRWGGYIVHVGIAILAIGVIWSSNFRIKEEMTLKKGVPTGVGDSEFSVIWVENESLPAGTPYVGEKVRFDIHKGDVLVSSLWPEMRRYPVKSDIPVISVPAIDRGFVDDYYIHYEQKGQGIASFTIFINPLVNWIWTGAVIMLLGGLFAALPMPRRRIGLSD